jgi:hypothetical protein
MCFIMLSRRFSALVEMIRAESASIRASLKEEVGAIKDEYLADRQTRDQIQSHLSTLLVTENEKAENRSYRRKNYAVQVMLAWGTCGAFVAAAIYAGIAARQLSTMKVTLSEIQKQTQNTELFFRTDERAWVEFEPLKPSVLASPVPFFGTIYKYELFPKNVGKTLARDVVINVSESANGPWTLGESEALIRMDQDKLLIGELRDQTGKLIPAPNNPTPKLLAPSTSSPVPLMLHGPPPVRSGKTINYGYLIGRIDYVDVFDVPHWVKFCFVIFDSNGDVENCKYGNDEDRNTENLSTIK